MRILLVFLLAFVAYSEEKKDGKLFDSDMGNEPTYITSDKLNFNAMDKTFTYTSNVVVKQKDMTMHADQIVGRYKKDNKIESLVATGNVVITQGPDLKATAKRATFLADKETLTLTENPQLEQKGSILNADKIVIYTKENRSEAFGTVSAKLVDSK